MRRSGLVLILGAGSVVAAGCTSSGPATDPTASRSTITEQLWTIASQAADDADSHALEARAVRTNRLAAARFTSRRPVGGKRGPGPRVWLVQIRGSRPFSCECTVIPSKSGDTTANYMLIVVDGVGLRMISGADLFASRQPLEHLGRVLDVHP